MSLKVLYRILSGLAGLLLLLALTVWLLWMPTAREPGYAWWLCGLPF